MSPHSIQRRLARLRRECDVAIGPLLLQLAAGIALILLLGLNAIVDESPAAPLAKAAQPTPTAQAR